MRIGFLSCCIAAVLGAACSDAKPAAPSRGHEATSAAASASPRAITAAERSCGLGGQAMANAYGPGAALAAAFAVTAPQMAAWLERWPVPGPDGAHQAVGTSPYRTQPASAVLSVCWFDGSFVNFGHAGGAVGAACPATGPLASVACVSGTNPPEPVLTRLVVTVDRLGNAALLSIGPREGLAISDPTAP